MRLRAQAQAQARRGAAKPATLAGDHASLTVFTVAAGDRLGVRLDGPALVVSIEVASIDVTVRARTSSIDRSTCLVLPRGPATFHTAAPASRVAIVTFHEPLVGRVAATYANLGLARPRLEGWLATAAILPRTRWVHELVHRYVFERYALGEHANDATRFLETELLKEVYFLFRDRDDGADRATRVREHSPAVERAIAYIEAALFEPCGVPELAAHAGASESTLVRAFRRELGATPGAYWRMRRLDEALVLVRSGRYTVAEVAMRVGYDNATAFGHAFRQRFGRAPSAFQPRHPVRPAP